MPCLSSSLHPHLAPIWRTTLELLSDARRAALETQLDVWDFAVEMADLAATGCTRTQLRRLVAAGYVEHASDVTRPSDARRRFKNESPLKFEPRTCFVVTPSGDELLSVLRDERSAADSCEANARFDARPPARRGVPNWDGDARELHAAGSLVKRFSRPAPLLELVLCAFEESAWPTHLDDPLPPARGIPTDQRLRETVRRLNRCQTPHLVHFTSDGLGSGIRWNWFA